MYLENMTKSRYFKTADSRWQLAVGKNKRNREIASQNKIQSRGTRNDTLFSVIARSVVTKQSHRWGEIQPKDKDEEERK